MSTNLDELKWIYEELSKQIDREFDLLGQRATLMVAGNAFLITATAISATKLPEGFAISLPTILLYGAAVVGIAICILSYRTMAAALDVIHDWKENRKNIEEQIKKEMPRLTFDLTPHNKSKSTYVGDNGYKLLPFLLGALWIAVMAHGLI